VLKLGRSKFVLAHWEKGLVAFENIIWGRKKNGNCSFIRQSTSTRRQQSDLLSLRVKLPPVTLLPTIEPLKGRGNPVKCLAQEQQTNLTACSHSTPLMLNVKQGNLKNQLFKSVTD